MVKAVFITKIDSIYDDLPEERYHFPKQYLKRIEQTIGDWIIYYEPRRSNGRQVYFSTAQVKAIREDENKKGHYYAEIASDSYLDFANLVPFKEGDFYYATSLLNPDGTINPGKAQNAVFHISEEEYQLIIQAGFAHLIDSKTASNEVLQQSLAGFAEDQTPFERPTTETIVKRPFRDQAFARTVKNAYDETCAFTGLRLINGGGNSEVQAAHIRPVHLQGPDSVRNGIALSATVHWMFDRGLVSIDDNYRVLKNKDAIPKAIDQLFLKEGKISLPSRPELIPHPSFLKFHRDNIFTET